MLTPPHNPMQEMLKRARKRMGRPKEVNEYISDIAFA